MQVNNFRKHQNPHCKESASTIPAPDLHGASTADSLLLIPDPPSPLPDSGASCARTIALDDFPVVGGESWGLAEEKFTEYADTFTGIDVPAELKKARQWLRDNPKRRKTADGMLRFLSSWLGRAQNKSRGTAPTTPSIARPCPPEKVSKYAQVDRDSICE